MSLTKPQAALCRVALVLLGALTLMGCGNTKVATRIMGATLPCVRGTMGCAVPVAKFGITPLQLSGKTLIPDVSEYQSCALHSEAVIRVYEAGTQREDTRARCHAQELHRLHAWAGAYAFLRSWRGCKATADRTVQIVRSLPVRVRVIIGDAETGIREGKVRCFKREIERLGYPSVEYTCPGCGDEQVGPVWIAAYPYRPTGTWVAHQFSSDFPCRGVRGDCSIDEGLLMIGSKSTKAHLLAQRQRIREYLASHGCRRRVRKHERLGPRCRGAFRYGARLNRELRTA